MNQEDVKAIINAHGGLDGAIILGFGLNFGKTHDERGAWILLNAYCNSPNHGPQGWRKLRIEVKDRIVASWEENPWNTNLVINHPAEVFDLDGRVVIDFDVLHSTVQKRSAKLSRFYIGGDSLIIFGVAPSESACA